MPTDCEAHAPTYDGADAGVGARELAAPAKVDGLSTVEECSKAHAPRVDTQATAATADKILFMFSISIGGFRRRSRRPVTNSAGRAQICARKTENTQKV